MGEEGKPVDIVCQAGSEIARSIWAGMYDDQDNNMEHEDNSLLTKFGVIFSVILLLIVAIGCLWILWEVVKFFIYWD